MLGSRGNLELSQVSPVNEVDWRSQFSISTDISKNCFWVTWLTHGLLDLHNDVINQHLFPRGVIPQKKKKIKKAVIGIVKTKLRKWLTC